MTRGSNGDRGEAVGGGPSGHGDSAARGDGDGRKAAAPAERPPARADEALRERVIDAIKTVYDPEIPVDIWELGLIYGLEIDEIGSVAVQMTLTTPACPVAGSLPGEVERTIREVPGVRDVVVDLVWDPPWSMERMSEPARLQLGFF